MSNFTKGEWKTIQPQHGHSTEYLSVQIGDDEMCTTLVMLPADLNALYRAAPDLYTAHLLRTVIDDVIKTSANESGNDAWYKSALALCVEHGYDASKNHGWVYELKDFVETYTSRAMAKAVGDDA